MHTHSPDISSSCMRHDPQQRRFVNALGDGRVLLKLQSACDMIQEARLVWRNPVAALAERDPVAALAERDPVAALAERDPVAALAERGRPQSPTAATTLTLQPLGNVNGTEYFAACVPAQAPIDYVFQLHACGQTRWVTARGLELNTPAREAWFRYDPRQHEVFATPDWVRDAVFYQIFPDRFCNGDTANDPPNTEPWGTPPTTRNFMGGDLQGILDKLDYFSDLGVSALYLTPIFKSASNHKYDIIDYFAVDEHFGDMALLRRLVDACHRRGIRVILDAVLNHCSNLHPYFLDVKHKGRASRYWNWFYIKKWPIPDRFAHHKDALEWYECWWGFHTLPKLNYTNPEVEDYFLNVAQFWLREAHTDGWRLDVPNEILHSFWPKFRRAVKEANPQAYIVGEIWDDATPWLQGDQFDAVMNYRFQKALLGYFAEETIDTRTLDHTLRQIMLDYPEQATAVMLNLLGSHDTARPMTVALHSCAGVSPAAAQTQTGGDARSTRALESLKLMAALQFTFEGAPCIYYGDEIGMEGGKDPDCRRCYPWGWELKAESREPRAELFAYYKKLIAIRRDNPALRAGTFRPFLVDDSRELYGFERRADGNHCIVVLNRSEATHTVQLPGAVHATELLCGAPFSGKELAVPARQAAILRLQR